MSALSAPVPRGPASPSAPHGPAAAVSADGSIEWLMKRNCSFAPRQLLAVYLSLCLLALAIAFAFWSRGALYVMPFATIELVAVGIALFIYAGHAADRERLVLRPGRLRVECTIGRRTEEVDFAPAWVRVEPSRADGSLIELTGEGRRIAVGRFIRPSFRRALADELRAALRGSGGMPAPA